MTVQVAIRWFLIGALLAGGSAVWVSPTVSAAGATYYVSPTGNDANAGTSPAQAWRTLARVQAALPGLGAGDQVLFERGAVYPGALAITASGAAGAPLTLGAYGSGARPVLSGLTRLTGWSSLGNNRWSVNCPSCAATVNGLWINGTLQPLARWPNPDEGDGYRYYQSASGGTSITDNTLPTTPSWVGGEAVIRTAAWLLDRLPITAQANGTLTFGASASYNAIQPGYGYFIQNHPAAMDRQGEWVYQPTSKTIMLLTATDPNTQRVEVPIVDTLIAIDNAGFVSLQGLELRGANTRNLNAETCGDVTVSDVVSIAAGISGLRLTNCRNVRVTQSEVRQSLNLGLEVNACSACRVDHNLIADIATVAGMGQSYDGNYLGVRFGGPGSVFEYNRVDNIGYLGIDIRGPATVRNNHVSRFNQVKVDGAGIYTWGNSDVRILDNLVTDGRGSTAGIPWEQPATHGIYIDDDSERIEVRGNTLARLGDSGIFLHNTRAVTVENNTVVAADLQALLLADDQLGSFGVTESVIRNNRFVATGVDDLMVQAGSNQTTEFFNRLGTVDGNLYCNVVGSALFRRYSSAIDAGDERVSLVDWRRLHGFDANGRECGQRYPLYTDVTDAGPERVANGTFDSTIQPWFGWPDTALEAAWDAGRLRVRNNGQNDIVHFDSPVGAITSGLVYRARFTANSDAGGRQMRVYLRQWNAPYTLLSEPVTVLLGTQPVTYEVYLPTTAGDPESLLIFELPRASQVVWLDNVSARQVTATAADVNALVRLETNPTESARTFTVTGYAYTDLGGNRYPAGATITLQPYRSIVLFRQEAMTGGVGFELRLPSLLRAR